MSNSELNSRTNEPKRHHYVPQFYLKNFAIDAEKKKVTLVRKHGIRAAWSKTSIKSIAYEIEFYTHIENDAPISVESKLNKNIENPISKSETWRKISEGCVSDLDRSDRKILYSLIRHLEVRTPHYLQTTKELALKYSEQCSDIKFSLEEGNIYKSFRENSNFLKETSNFSASNIAWAAGEFHSCAISIFRTQKPVFVCTTPVLAMSTPNHPLLRSTQLGIHPFNTIMPLDPYSYVMLSIGDFGGAFVNQAIQPDVEDALKRRIVGQFAYWPAIQHLICPADDLAGHLDWAGYDLTKDTPSRKLFQRRENSVTHQFP